MSILWKCYDYSQLRLQRKLKALHSHRVSRHESQEIYLLHSPLSLEICPPSSNLCPHWEPSSCIYGSGPGTGTLPSVSINCLKSAIFCICAEMNRRLSIAEVQKRRLSGLSVQGYILFSNENKLKPPKRWKTNLCYISALKLSLCQMLTWSLTRSVLAASWCS